MHINEVEVIGTIVVSVWAVIPHEKIMYYVFCIYLHKINANVIENYKINYCHIYIYIYIGIYGALRYVFYTIII